MVVNNPIIRVIIADDVASIRKAIRKLFESSPDIQIVGEAANGQEAVDLIDQLQPDVLLLDIQMPVMDGVQVIDCLRQSKSGVRVLILSAFLDHEYTSEVLARGAWGYYLKEEAPTLIVEAVRQAGRGEGQGTRPRPSPKVLNKLVNAQKI